MVWRMIWQRSMLRLWMLPMAGEIDLAGRLIAFRRPDNPRGVRMVNGMVIGAGSAARSLNSYTRNFDFVHGRA